MQITLTMTDAALAYIDKMIAKENGIAFRLAIKQTGCSGYSYVPSVIQQINADDMLVPQVTVPFYIDKQSLALLTNIHIDYVEENQMGLKQKRLVYSNPQEASRCGCGESFHLKQD